MSYTYQTDKSSKSLYFLFLLENLSTHSSIADRNLNRSVLWGKQSENIYLKIHPLTRQSHRNKQITSQDKSGSIHHKNKVNL